MIDPMVITFIILAAAVVLFLSDRLRVDLVALLVALSLGLTGVLTAQETFSGFSRTAVMTIMGIFVLAEGLQRTRVTERVGGLLVRVAGKNEAWMSMVVMGTGAFLSLFMNTIAAASVLLPAVSGAARKSGVRPSRLLMPLAFGTLLGGSATLLTTTNIVVSSLLRDNNLQGFGLLDFAPVGLVLVAAGMVYMAVWGRRKLPEYGSNYKPASGNLTEGSLPEIYRLDERFLRMQVIPESDLVGVPLGECLLRERYHLNVVAIERDTKPIYALSPDITFRPGDIVWVEGRHEEVSPLHLGPSLQLLPNNGNGFKLNSPTVIVCEAVLAPRSALIGQTLVDAHFREKYEMNVLAIWRAGRPIRTHLEETPLHFGDALLLQGPRNRMPALRTEPDLIVLSGGHDDAAYPRGKSILAIVIMLGTLLLASFGPYSIGEVMIAGAVLMVLMGVLTMDQAYTAIDWKSIFLVAGMLPMGIAMTKTGAANLLGEKILAVVGPLGPLALLAGMVILAVLLTQTMNGAAVSTFLTPIAIDAALRIGAEPRALAMGVAVATSMAFITPLGHPVNILVMGPGGYRFRDMVASCLAAASLTLIDKCLLGVMPVEKAEAVENSGLKRLVASRKKRSLSYGYRCS
jgi:di/tricarboxylate transporter